MPIFSHPCVVSTAIGGSRNLSVHAFGRNSLISSNYLPKDWQGTLNVLTMKISRQFIVQDNLLLTVLRHVVQSRCVFLIMMQHLAAILSPRHPKFTYIVGVYPVLRLAFGSAPVSARIAVKRLVHWAKALKTVA
jgi:hypothetical protein